MKIELLDGIVTLSNEGISGVSVKVKPDDMMKRELIKSESERNINDLEFVEEYGEDILFRLAKRVEKCKTCDGYDINKVLKRETCLPDGKNDVCQISVFSDSYMNVIARITMIIDNADYEFDINVSEEDIEVLKWVSSNYRLQ